MLLTLIALALAAPPDDHDLGQPQVEVREALEHYLSAEETTALLAHLDQVGAEVAGDLARHGEAHPERVRQVLYRVVADNLGSKVLMDRAGPHLPMTADEIRQTVIDYEAFKLGAYVSSGVFPKRYFGYFDLKYDTAEHEWTLRQVVRCTTRVINAYQEEQGSPLRVNDAEIAVTFISEGGALLLREDQHRMNDLHPVFDVGLDDVAKGNADYPGLIRRLDEACGTDLGGLVVYTEPHAPPPPGATDRLASHDGRWGWLVRPATFEEGIVGTAMMWIWEKEIAAAKLDARGSTPLHRRDLADQFISGSLVYNSGIIHSESTARRIREWSTGDYLYERSQANASRRPLLDLQRPSAQLHEVLSTGSYRGQPTSWVAVYHILQRYGGWEALRRYTDTFDDAGMFRPREQPSPPPPPPAPEPAEPAEPAVLDPPAETGCGCAQVPPTTAWLSGLALITLGRRRRPMR